MQASIRTSMNTVRRHLYIAATVQGVVMAVVVISLGAWLPLFRPPSQLATTASNDAAQQALREQQIAEWTEVNVTQVDRQRPVSAGLTIAADGVASAAGNARKEQQIAEWTEINVTQLEEQSPLPGHSSAADAVDAAARNEIKEQQIAAWTEINVTQLETQAH